MGFQVTEKDGSGRDSAVYSVDVTQLVNGNGAHAQADLVPRIRTRAYVKGGGHRSTIQWAQVLRGIFLPAGYPASVSSDYLRCQFYYGVQAFCSSLAGLIANRAVLEGHGIGKAEASATDAMLLTVLQDAFSRLTTILAAYFLGTSLYPEAKTYRLIADIANDIAIFFDLLSPQLSPYSLVSTFPFVAQQPGTGLRLAALCLSGAFRALCGVTAGGARAALTLHFAQDGEVMGDVGDLSAKDASKETVLALLGMLCGSLLMPHLRTAWSTYTVVLILLGCHLLANYIAVRVVVMRSINRQRASILWSTYRALRQAQPSLPQEQHILTPDQVAQKEYTFGHADVLYHTVSQSASIVGRSTIGAAFSDVFVPRPIQWWTFWKSSVTPDQAQDTLGQLLDLFTKDRFILWREMAPARFGAPTPQIRIFLKDGHNARDHLKAWVHAAEFATQCRLVEASTPSETLDRIKKSQDVVNTLFDPFVKGLQQTGWDLDAPGLISGSPVTIRVEGDVEHWEDKKNV